MTDNMTPREAARALNITLGWVYFLLWDGSLEGTKVAGRWSISRESVERRRESVAAGRATADHADEWRGRARQAASRRS